MPFMYGQSATPSNLGGYSYTQHSIPGGVSGTIATVGYMVGLIQSGELKPTVRQAAMSAIRHCRNKDKLCESKSIYDWIQQNIRFVNDPWGAELLHEADSILVQGGGDCDDHAILAGSMLRSIGIQVRVVIIGTDKSRPQAFSHVYLQAMIRGSGWVGFDTSVPGVSFGWEAPQFTAKKVIEVP